MVTRTGEPFVEVREAGVLPSVSEAVHRNVVVVGIAGVEVELTLLVVVAQDNLVKGAAGQAIQNANLMLGLEETEGLAQ